MGITVDAYLYGMGATLQIQGKPIQYIETRLDGEDVKRYQHEIGSATGQQT